MPGVVSGSPTYLASIPSPSQGVWDIGPFPLRAYALGIIAGVLVAVWLGERRWQERGGRAGTVSDVAVWAVPFGVVGGRIYHVITTPEPYFGKGGKPLDALKIWEGGLGIWGAIALGAVGAWVGCRRRGIALPPFADAIAPGIVIAQGIGRFGNWFNQELYGRPTTLPWGLEIDPEHRPADSPGAATYQPAFLYEAIWDFGVAGLVLWADRRFRLGHGRAFMLYVAAYVVGRSWIEALRVDTAEHFLGLRLNQFTAAVLFVISVTYIIVSLRRRPGREEQVEPGRVASSDAEPGGAELDAVEPGGAELDAVEPATAAAELTGADGGPHHHADADHVADADHSAVEPGHPASSTRAPAAGPRPSAP